MMRTTYVGTYVGYLYLRRLRRIYEHITYGRPWSVCDEPPSAAQPRTSSFLGVGQSLEKCVADAARRYCYCAAGPSAIYPSPSTHAHGTVHSVECASVASSHVAMVMSAE
eukprot:scaffold681_cov153-Isochrysis_galbana.AAC.3